MTLHSLPLRRVALLLLAAALALPSAGCYFRKNSYNLMKLARPTDDAVVGTWTREKSLITSERVDHARLSLRMVPHGDYRLQVKFDRAIGEDAVAIVLPVDDRQVALVLDARRGDEHYSGLELVDGRRAHDNTTTDRVFELINHQIYRVDVHVRTKEDVATVNVDVDKKPFVRWTGPVQDLDLPREWTLAGNARLGVGSNNGVIRVRSAWLHMIPAKATRLE